MTVQIIFKPGYKKGHETLERVEMIREKPNGDIFIEEENGDISGYGKSQVLSLLVM